MPMMTKPAFGPRVALIYVTIGALIDVWTIAYYFTVIRDSPVTNTTWFWLSGLFFTGLTLVVLGLLLGPLGRAARKAELPPAEALNKEANIQQTAAATGTPPAAPAQPTVQATVQPVAPPNPAVVPAPPVYTAPAR